MRFDCISEMWLIVVSGVCETAEPHQVWKLVGSGGFKHIRKLGARGLVCTFHCILKDEPDGCL